MAGPLSPVEFAAKWRAAGLKERAAAQEHFLDLCRMLGQPTPAEADADGAWYAFERGVTKTSGGGGFADVWMRGHFAWEYKGPRKDLRAAYQQLLQYREDLENPPLLVVCDLDRFEVHTNFTGTAKRVYAFDLSDLASPTPTPGSSRPPLEVLRAIFTDPNKLRPDQTAEQVTEQAAAEFGNLAASLREREPDPEKVAHFLMRLLFCLFAEDIALLPAGLFTRLVDQGRRQPASFAPRLRQLFGAMATGGFFGEHDIKCFNGGLFADDAVLALTADELAILARAGQLDWSSIEPAIFGTLFERSLDPSKRSQLGAHYTSRADIDLIVEPVLLAPLRRRWDGVQARVGEILDRRDAAAGPARARQQQAAIAALSDFAAELRRLRVLDPACGSGNFLYVCLKHLLDLEKEVVTFAGHQGLPTFFPRVEPDQLFGIEINAYAKELAQVVVWIGYIQWLRDNGFGVPDSPILKPLDNIRQMDAILAFDAAGRPFEPEWPAADVIVGNPPFLGGKRLRAELGDERVDQLFGLYDGRVPREADLVCYWFERTRAMIEAGQVRRAGLLATQAIRMGASRRVLEQIRQAGDIFMAWSDRPWVLDGAAVRVSIVGFDNGEDRARTLNGESTPTINANLTAAADLTTARPLQENAGLSFMGDTKVGPFDIPREVAERMLAAKGNPNGRPNSDVVRPWANGLDVTRRPRGIWIIDFGTSMREDEAALYEMPFEYVRRHVHPERSTNNRKMYREKWWIHAEVRPEMRSSLARRNRFIVTPGVAKHRIFAWLSKDVLPDHRLTVIAREDDYFFGVLHSRPHEVWALATSSRHGDGSDGGRPTYNNTTCFETFPFPWPPGLEPADDPRVIAIAEAARDLVDKRDRWLNPEGATEAELKRRTLTNLYNARPAWLDLAHRKLDAAVFAAYGWPADLSDEEILARLLDLNQQRAARTGAVAGQPAAEPPDAPDTEN